MDTTETGGLRQKIKFHSFVLRTIAEKLTKSVFAKTKSDFSLQLSENPHFTPNALSKLCDFSDFHPKYADQELVNQDSCKTKPLLTLAHLSESDVRFAPSLSPGSL